MISDPEADGGAGDGPPSADPLEYPVDGVLDLHQFRPEDARDVVDDYLDACREKGIVDVRVIHGKGKGVLRRIVHSALEARDDVASFRLATDGGSWGATEVHLEARRGGDPANASIVGGGLGGKLLAVTVGAALVLAVAGCSGQASDAEAGGAAPPTAPAAEEGRGQAEATSLLGDPLYRPELPASRREALEANLATALQEYRASPADQEAIIWYGRRLAYLSRYREALQVYSEGIDRFPDSFKLLRHRGHRFISVRELDHAIDDLQRAAELAASQPVETEPDGAPNALGIPLSNGHFNIWYHLGLAHYLKGDFESARDAYLRCMEYSDNNDLLVATSDWLYMTYRRLGEEEAAAAVLEAITPDMEIIENDAYHRRLLMYKGEVAPEELLDLRAETDPDIAMNIATQGYGVGNWYYVNGDVEQAKEVFERILERTSWAAFGYIAAEADLQRLVGQR